MKQYSRHEHAVRNGRLKKFKNKILPFIALEYDVEIPVNHSYRVLDTPKGDIIIYPKAWKIKIERNNEWVMMEMVFWLNFYIMKTKIKI